MFDMFETNFSNPAFLGYVNECEEEYHKQKLDGVIADLIGLNLSLYDSIFDTCIVCSSHGLEYETLSEEDIDYINNQLRLNGIY